MKNSSKLITLVSGLIIAVFLSQCVPPEQQQAEMLALQKAKRDSMRKANYNKCAFKLSNADQYKLQENYSMAIENYKTVIDLGCAEDFYNPLFEDMAYCFFKENKTDSASWSIEEGLIYDNTDRHMLDLFAYYNKNDIEKSIEIISQINTLYPDDPETMFKLADMYFQAERYDEQIEVLDQILALDPTNKDAERQIVAAYEASGRDPLERIASVFESDKTNANNGYRYGNMLFERGDYTKAMEVLKESASFNSGNRNLIELLAQVYELEGKMAEALVEYKKLAQRYNSDQALIIKVARLYLDEYDFKTALEYAEKAISIPPANGKAYQLRGDVYYAVAEACAAEKGKAADFNDKLVFHMAYEDYKKAVSQGNRSLSSRINFMKKNEIIIGGKRDYFLASEANKAGVNKFKPLGACYSWITRIVKI